MGEIDRIGCFRGNIVESGVGATKNGYPQFTGRFHAKQKWVDDKAEFEAFGITEPSWVDWSEYDQYLTGFLVLMTEDKDTHAPKEIFHMDALRKALGWDGASFGTLGSTDWSGKDITFWVEENEYQGNVSLRVNAVAEADASPNRTLRTLDASGLKDLDAKFAGILAGNKKAATPATAPAKAPAKPGTPPAAGKPAPGKPAAPGAKAAAPTAAASAPASTKTPPKATTPPKVTKPAPSAPADTSEASASAETQETAWNKVLAGKGAATDDQMAEKWIDACTAIAPGKDETTMTSEEWTAVAAKTLELLAA